jgi:hypothetical protein
MNTGNLWISASAMAICYPCYIAFLLYSARVLPERPAVHFSLVGRANGWMRRGWYLFLMFMIGTIVPLIPVVTSIILRSSSKTAYLGMVAHALWFACMALGFFAGLHFLVIRANQKAPPRISMLLLLVVTAAFGTGVVLWEKSVPH